MSLYPSLEDMKVDGMIRAQIAQSQATQPYQQNYPPVASATSGGRHVYPALGDYMGLELSSDVIALNMPEYLVQSVSHRLIKLISN